MKKLIITIIATLTLLIVTAMPATAGRGNRGYDNRNYGHMQHDNGYHRGWHHSHQYRHHEYNGKRYNYRGHHGSWDSWEHYKRSHPYIERHGHYYHEGGHLMFRFSDPDGNCFFFSIGR